MQQNNNIKDLLTKSDLINVIFNMRNKSQNMTLYPILTSLKHAQIHTHTSHTPHTHTHNVRMSKTFGIVI